MGLRFRKSKKCSGTIEYNNLANEAKPNGCLTVVTCIGIILLAICLIFAMIYANR